jgi:hypothetical protein
MANYEKYPKVIFPEGFDERSKDEMSMRGYLSHALIELEDGQCYPIFFMDPIRLQQELDLDIKNGNPCLAEPGLVILSSVTVENIEAAVSYLWKDGFFSHLKPVAP